MKNWKIPTELKSIKQPNCHFRSIKALSKNSLDEFNKSDIAL